ncbi:sulfite exporter TauE/SafE family protein [Apilactobacillus timberlakei]|uniref:Probable membrane transporter protein n=1 Tax=Apilactobacillus timberlakei TaxID=2008380 RepID=A0ABY2YTK5_9LACO|nr:sulfite exporter TauE/SafE family protein [Apilactobacillus timberlakei]TPR14274.1 sulfite exporter TauE/SafE family protein [Apilactobacillus timberlakei]TPR16527.1 sulfite exporter TauE/SafE family protein [Apilactobacillus timberlakei]TPR19214.1 sulfite exporter TauE/SafE family protein [Apilactobacillus timberlakei]
MTFSTIIFLIFIGIISGIINSIIGMASLISYPALISVGIPPVLANASNTVALISSGISSTLSSLKELRGHWKQVTPVILLNAIGGLIGSVLLLHSSNAAFSKIIPFLIFFAACSILIPKKPKLEQNKKSNGLFFEYLILGLVGIYVGYFGAGAGVIMIAVLSRISESPYNVYNATRNVATLASNLVASIIFILVANLYWKEIIILAIGLFIGGFIGPKIVRYIPTKIMKNGVGIFAIFLSIYLFIKAFF